MIKSHGSEQEAVVDTKGEIEEELSGTALDSNGLVRIQVAIKHMGNDGHSVAGLRDGQHAQEKVHGSMEVMIQANNSHNDDIARRVSRYKIRKTTNKTSLCCHPKLEKPSKRNSVTAVEFGFSIEGCLGLKELGKGKKGVMSQPRKSRLDESLQ